MPLLPTRIVKQALARLERVKAKYQNEPTSDPDLIAHRTQKLSRMESCMAEWLALREQHSDAMQQAKAAYRHRAACRKLWDAGDHTLALLEETRDTEHRSWLEKATQLEDEEIDVRRRYMEC